MVEAARLLRVSVLNHGRIFAELHREVGAAGARDAHGLGALQPLARVPDRLLEAGRRHQRFELVGTVDDHEHPRAGLARLLEPAREQGDVQTNQHVGRLDRLERALAASHGLDPDLGPRRHGIDAHLVGVGAELLGRGKGGGDVIAPRPEVAQQHHGLALAHVAKLEFLAEEHREFGVVQRFVHGMSPPYPESAALLRPRPEEARSVVSKDGAPRIAASCFETYRSATVLLRQMCSLRAAMLLSMRPNRRFHNSRYSTASFQVSRCPMGFALRRKARHSSRSRALLRKICSLPARYCGGQWISAAPYQAAAFMLKYGSTRCGRANATRSARPAAMMVLTWSAVVIAPTHMVASEASLRI